jgi:hypothetical protein
MENAINSNLLPLEYKYRNLELYKSARAIENELKILNYT